jgi:tRNA pseudouridine(55) synthase
MVLTASPDSNYNARMNGVLVIDKPSGMTSHDVVARVRRILGERRIGHTGTLDPFATGVLVLLVGQATRLAQFLTAADKEYEAVIRLGFATDTGDREGKEILGSRLEAPVNRRSRTHSTTSVVRFFSSRQCTPQKR